MSSLSTGVVSSPSGIFFFGGSFLTDLFTDDPRVWEAATQYAVILAFSQTFVAWESLEEGVLTGAGDTSTIFWWSVPLNVLRIPTAWVLAFPLGWGAAGIWWAINVTTILKTAGKGWAVWRGGWTRLQFDEARISPDRHR